MTTTRDWRTRAVCREDDPELFFPIGDKGFALLQAEEAKSVCRRCPVQDECLDSALATNAEGVWGGTTEAERRAIKRAAARNPRPRTAKTA
ncbi:WhiB family transcriptional regulator [Streptomyces alkaliterrae]|uniref:Transcriptional regulator WhiB n=1 Tax=Streptomyces alkaliterrae TaxID=2213162 RepID=A0A5P0YMS2_9ACTN|nr:WhiB family transcriptional regulator [Streptomyces alkaliterrae]MBB1258303.1 WhiB family transcriptional regulator [Streptomyces alkaliterrae]MQS00712.1 WhiB family transcriptional regulator [Streptomyces alkaliterrae]